MLLKEHYAGFGWYILLKNIKGVILDYKTFKKIEELLLDYGLLKAMEEVEDEEEVDLETAKKLLDQWDNGSVF